MADGRLQQLSEDFVQLLFKSTHGYFTPETLDKLINLFELEMSRHYFTKSSESNLIRMFGSILDKTFFLNECLKYPHHVEILVAIASNSNYLTDIIVRNPEYLYMLFDNNRLEFENETPLLSKEITAKLNGFNSFSGKLNYLRLLKRREILRIGTNDILGNWDLEKVVKQLAVLAMSILDNLFLLCLHESCVRFGIKKFNRAYCLLALGKLGGLELNYSSDVDLMVIYDRDSTMGGHHTIDILSEAIKLFTQSSSEITQNGYIYRVDFRLRPDGKTAPLATTFLDSMNYYEARGEDWERQMLTKLNFVSGSTELYNKFRAFVRGYVYGATFRTSPQETIIRMKRNIEMNSNDMNIKTVEGGIRDIEFSVQALQILNGKRHIALQSANTLSVLSELREVKLISHGEFKTFYDAYILYRRIEHWLQLMNDKQTHTIPTDLEMLNKLSRYLGFRNSDQFNEKLGEIKSAVRKVYNSIVGVKNETDKVSLDLSKIKFEDRQRAQKNIEFLQSGKGLIRQKQFDSKTINLFSSISVDLLAFLSNAVNPDMVLENFAKVMQNVKFVDIWYSEFSNKKFFNHFLRLMQCSQFAVDLLAVNNELKDFFISRKVFTKKLEVQFDNYSFNQIKLALAVQFTLGLKSAEQVSEVYSSYVAYHISKLSDAKKYGYKFFLGGLGSFGANEMTFFSDVDLIVVVDKIDNAPNSHSDFQELLNDIPKKLPGVEVDFRLRPEGKSSPLVWDIENYKKYLDERAGVWEFQALLKLKFLCGDKKLFQYFKKLLSNRIKKMDNPHIKTKVKEMHEKSFSHSFTSAVNIKKNRGSLTTIQYLIQYFVLLHNKLISRSIGKSTTKLINILIKHTAIKELGELRNNYIFLKNLEFWLQNMFNQRSANIPSGEKKLQMLADAMNLPSVDEFELRIRSIIKNSSSQFLKHIN